MNTDNNDTQVIDFIHYDRNEVLASMQELQHRQKVWEEANFGIQTPERPMRGMMEELGEMEHAILKAGQGIRGSQKEHEDGFKDSLADIGIFYLGLLNRLGMEEVFTPDKFGNYTFPKPLRDRADGVLFPSRLTQEFLTVLHSSVGSIYGGVMTDCYGMSVGECQAWMDQDDKGVRRQAITQCLVELFIALNSCCLVFLGESAEEVIKEVASTVFERNWKQDPDKGE